MSNLQNSTVTAKAVKTARSNEPVLLRYKGTILIVLTGLVSILSQVATLPEWDGTIIGVVCTITATAVGALVNRFTKDGITPSMVGRIAAYAPDDPQDTPQDTLPVPAYDPVIDYATYINHVTPPGEDEGQYRVE